MTERRARSDALRNHAAVLAAADDLFARSDAPGSVSMDDIAVAAGVGKGTLFRRFGDRTGLIRALFDARSEPWRLAVRDGPPPLGPGSPPRERVLAVLDRVLLFKLDNRHLSLALEEGGGSPYASTYYGWVHGVLRDLLRELAVPVDPDWTAHVLLAATRADLVDQLVDREDVSPDVLRANLAALTERLLGP